MLSYMLEIEQSPTNRKITIIPHHESIHPEEIVFEEDPYEEQYKRFTPLEI